MAERLASEAFRATVKASLAIDAVPVGSCEFPRDHGAQQLSSATMRPLVTHSASGSPSSARAVERRGGGGWRIELEDLDWSDGRPLAADHVLEAFQRLPGRRGSLAYALLDVGSPHPARAVGKRTVDIRMGSAGPELVRALLTLPELAPCRPGDARGRPALGPYSIVSAAPERLALERNPHAGGTTAPDHVDIVVVPDVDAQLRSVEAGRLDVTTLAGFGARHLLGPTAALSTAGLLPLYGCLEIGRRAPRSLRFSASHRRALSEVIDRSAIAAAATGLVRACADLPGVPAQPGIHVGEVDRDPATRQHDDALRQLAELRAVEIAYADFEPNGSIVSQVAEQLLERLQLVVRKRPLDYRQYVAAAATGEFELLYSLVAADVAHPAAFLGPGRLPRWTRAEAYEEREVGRLLHEAVRSDDWSALAAAAAKQQGRIALIQMKSRYQQSDRLQPIQLTAGGTVDFDELSVAATHRVTA